MNKKISALLLAGAMMLSLAACGAKEEAPAPAPSAPSTSTSTEATGEVAGGSTFRVVFSWAVVSLMLLYGVGMTLDSALDLFAG